MTHFKTSEDTIILSGHDRISQLLGDRNGVEGGVGADNCDAGEVRKMPGPVSYHRGLRWLILFVHWQLGDNE